MNRRAGGQLRLPPEGWGICRPPRAGNERCCPLTTASEVPSGGCGCSNQGGRMEERRSRNPHSGNTAPNQSTNCQPLHDPLRSRWRHHVINCQQLKADALVLSCEALHDGPRCLSTVRVVAAFGAHVNALSTDHATLNASTPSTLAPSAPARSRWSVPAPHRPCGIARPRKPFARDARRGATVHRARSPCIRSAGPRDPVIARR